MPEILPPALKFQYSDSTYSPPLAPSPRHKHTPHLSRMSCKQALESDFDDADVHDDIVFGIRADRTAADNTLGAAWMCSPASGTRGTVS